MMKKIVRYKISFKRISKAKKQLQKIGYINALYYPFNLRNKRISLRTFYHFNVFFSAQFSFKSRGAVL